MEKIGKGRLREEITQGGEPKGWAWRERGEREGWRERER